MGYKEQQLQDIIRTDAIEPTIALLFTIIL